MALCLKSAISLWCQKLGNQLKIGVDMCEDVWILLIPIKTLTSVFQAIHMFLSGGVLKDKHGREMPTEVNGNVKL